MLLFYSCSNTFNTKRLAWPYSDVGPPAYETDALSTGASLQRLAEKISRTLVTVDIYRKCSFHETFYAVLSRNMIMMMLKVLKNPGVSTFVLRR